MSRSAARSLVSSLWSVSIAALTASVIYFRGGADGSGGESGRVPGSAWHIRGMTAPQVIPAEHPEVDTDATPEVDRPWVTIVWNDPVNLMSYVTWVFQKLFGYSRERAERLMLDVHHRGKAVVSSGARERMEYHASQLHGHGLWATVDQS